MTEKKTPKQPLSPDLKRLPEIFQNFPDVLAVYLFGSAITGKIHRESDLDLAIVPRTSKLRRRRLEILTELARHGFTNVDLVFLDTDDIVLKFEAVRPNYLVYQREEFDRGDFYAYIIRLYLDFLPYLDRHRAAYKRRLLDGQT